MSRDVESHPRPEDETRDRPETTSLSEAAGRGATAAPESSSAAAETTHPASAGPAVGVGESGAGSAVWAAPEPAGESWAPSRDESEGESAVGRAEESGVGPAGGVVESGVGSAVEPDGESDGESGGESGGEFAVGRAGESGGESCFERDGESHGESLGESGGESGGENGGENGGETAVGLAEESLSGPATARGAQAEWEDEDEWEDEAEWEGREFGGGGLLPPVAAHHADLRSAALSAPTALGGTAPAGVGSAGSWSAAPGRSDEDGLDRAGEGGGDRVGEGGEGGEGGQGGQGGDRGDRGDSGERVDAGDVGDSGERVDAGEAGERGETDEGGERGGHGGEGDGAVDLRGDVEGGGAGRGAAGGGGDASDGGGADEADGAEAGESGAGRRRVLRWSRSPAAVLVGVLIGLLGFGLAVQVRSNTSTSGLPAARQEDLVRILDDLSSREDRLRRQIAELEAARARLSSAGDTSSTALQEARTRSEALGILAGTVAAQGPGVVLTITDPDHRLAAEDLLDTVEELRAAGAEAIQVGGVRIGLDSSFTAADTGIAVDGVAVTVPYTILAIGDPPTLATAMGIPGGVADTAKRAGGEARTEERQQVVIHALRPVKSPHYSRPTN